ncbi:MAG: PilZ domain-containing protein [Candidatus Omnitrophica bacterium]|nr:PilZ domain-containing protein [Candidatus Omnitrophota bacterium]
MSEKDTAMQDRRKFVRLNAAVEVDYIVLDSESQQREHTATKNISAGGICLIAHEQLRAGDILSLTFSLPNNESPIIVKGKVVWIKSFKVASEKESYDVGIEFIDINEVNRERIDKYVFSLS